MTHHQYQKTTCSANSIQKYSGGEDKVTILVESYRLKV